MIVNTDGIIIRMFCSGISILGRITSGVKLINLKDDTTVASIEKVRDEEKEEEKRNLQREKNEEKRESTETDSEKVERDKLTESEKE